MRAFIAIELSRKIKGEIEKFQKTIDNPNILTAKYVEPKNIHLTLKFLDEISDEQVIHIRALLEKICKRHKKFEINFKGLKAFPNENYVNVLWVGVEKGDVEAKVLQKSIDNELSKLGFKPEKDYLNHLTIARIKSVINKAKLTQLFKTFENLSLVGLKVEKVSLVKSTLTGTGPIYETISEHVLS